MARLNEPAAPMESVESLKRRFLRQNREIARANSTQSLRIRNLENEVSRLLAENLGLREQISRYKNDLENSQTQKIQDYTDTVKAHLEEKLLELSTIISGLGQLPNAEKKSPRRGRITSYDGQTGDRGRRKSTFSPNEVGTDQDGRLPPILENKLYPRRTLECQEILDIAENIELDSTDSPEIGPPPVSQFVNEDPVKIELPKRNRRETNEEISELDALLSINLEQRRKRKDNIELSGSQKGNRSEMTACGPEGVGTLKTGAKRKLCVREDDEDSGAVTQAAGNPSDFEYTRVVQINKPENKVVSQAEVPVVKTARELAVAKGVTRKKESNPAAISQRKVLALKSVNNSPKKAGRVLCYDDGKPAKPHAARSSSVMERQDRRETIPAKPSIAPVILNTEVDLEPETPAALDLSSPGSSQPSTARTGSRDTPPPLDLAPGIDGQRPSRRARGAVSYAEPNLRDKMRRPTKGLIDAVVRDDRIHRSSLLEVEDGLKAMNAGIKSEFDDNDSWKNIPVVASSATLDNSPLRSKVSVPESLPGSITTHRKRRESLLQQVEAEAHRPGSGSAIAALLAKTRKAKAAVKEDRGPPNDVEIGDAISKLDIYEFKDTSPRVNDVERKSEKNDGISSRNSRRPSSALRDIVQTDDSEASDMETTRRPSASASRRRQSTLGIRGSAAGNQPINNENGENSLKRSLSTTSVLGANGHDATHDRISARRRSMML